MRLLTALLLLLAAVGVDARTKPTACSGRFDLLSAPPFPGATAIVVDGKTVEIVPGCLPRRGKVKAGRKATVVSVRWPACTGVEGKLTLHARIAAPECTSLDGTFKSKGSKQPIPVQGEESTTTTTEESTTTTTCPPGPDCVPLPPTTCDDGGVSRPTVIPQPGDLVITEIMPSPAAVGDTTGEWFEVLVTRDVDLNGLVLDRAGDASPADVLDSPTCRRATAGSHLVFARSSDPNLNGQLPRVDGVFTFSLVAGSPGAPGDVRLLAGPTLLDGVAWTGSRSGKALQLDPDVTTTTDNDVESNFCDAVTAYGAGDLGTPGAANVDCAVVTPGTCLDGGSPRTIVAPAPGQLVLSEWMPDPTLVTDANGEWFEVRALADVDLNGLQAGGAILGTTPIVPAGGSCVPLAFGAFALFAHNSAPNTNGMLPPVDGTFAISLSNTAGTLQIGFGGVTLDTKTWSSSTAGRAIMIDSDGTQCDAPAGVALYNGTDVGTPRAANVPPECP